MSTKKISKENVQKVLPLTSLQKGILFRYLESDHSDYIEQLCVTINGSVEYNLFKQTWTYILNQNQILKAVYRWENLKEPVQIILKEFDLPIKYINLSKETKHINNKLGELLQLDRQQIFDIQNGCIRITLIELGPELFKMIISNVNILYDGWSIGVLCKDFLEFYQMISEGVTPELKSKIQFIDYVEWLTKKEKKTSRIYWEKALENWQGKTKIPYCRVIDASNDIATFTWSLENDLQEKIVDLSVKYNVTQASLYYAAWGALLQQYNENSDIVFGALVSGKDTAFDLTEDMVGLFTNCVPFRIQFKENQLISDYLHSVNRLLIECHEFSNIDNSEIRKICSNEKSDTLYDSVVIIENYPIPDISKVSMLKLSDFSLWEKTNFPLVLRFSNFNGNHITMEYKKSCFLEQDIQLLLSCYIKILQQFIVKSEKMLNEIEIIPNDQKKSVLQQWNYTKRIYPSDKLLHQLFSDCANLYPDHIALKNNNKILTYKQLDNISNKFAWYLSKLGLAKGLHIAVYMDRSMEAIIVLLGILKSGCICVPLDTSFPDRRINLIIEDSQAQLIIYNEKEFNCHKNIDSICYRNIDFDLLPEHALECESNSDDLAYLIYTSGSTGIPKGTMLTHRGIINHAFIKKDVLNITDQDVVANNFSLHVVAAIWQIWTAFLSAATVVQYANELEFDIYALLKQAEHDKVSIIEIIPSQLATYLDLIYGGEEKLSLYSFRYIALTSEEIRPNTVRKFYQEYKILLVNCYGQTECSDDVLHYIIPNDFMMDDVPLGKPSNNTRIYILSNTYQLRPIGFPGKIFVSGDGVSKGYWQKDEYNKIKFIKNPYKPEDIIYDTGDIGIWTENGLVKFCGRTDHQIKLRGNRIELREVEKYLSEVPGIHHAAVSVGNEKGKDAVLYGFYTADQKISSQNIRKFLHNQIPSYMIPARFIFLEKMPLLPNGKVDRKKLEEVAMKNIDITDDIIYAESYDNGIPNISSEIFSIWEHVLKHNNFSNRDYFFEIGGNSLLLLQVRSQLEKKFMVKIPVADLFRYATINDLSTYISLKKENVFKEDTNIDNNRYLFKDKETSRDIAIIGIACRFPGAETKEEFFDVIMDGNETLSRFEEDSLLLDSKSPAKYIPVWGKLKNVDCFDYEFFNFTRTESEIMDPQQRLFLECSWEALEDAGYDPSRYEGDIGVFAGVGPNYYMINNLLPNEHLIDQLGEFLFSINNDKDYLATRVSHKLGLTGPSMTIQTACSTSLSCVHMAVRALQNRDSDIMLAGAVSIRFKKYNGYYINEHGNMSSSGHCRPFDAGADGTVFGDGVAVVVLKRLEDAIKDHDQIWCTIKGSAINNDGNFKVGYTAPSVDQQTDVIKKAYCNARVEMNTIGYVETHGTATQLGDSIEIAALEKAFGSTGNEFSCPIGSVKAIIGHTDVVSGIAGLIKTAYMIRNQVIAPNIYFNKLNDEIEMKHFYLPQTIIPWKERGVKRRAGVSSFGIGGTNVHVVLEQAPQKNNHGDHEETYYILPISAKNETLVKYKCKQLAKWLTINKQSELRDVSYTLLNGRSLFPYRASLVISSHNEAANKLTGEIKIIKAAIDKTYFLFSGQGANPCAMGHWLYDHFPIFKQHVDLCINMFMDFTSYSRTDFFIEHISDKIDLLPEIAQINIFIYQYAMAKLLMYIGIKPDMVIGHSIGEFVAACICGVYTLKDTIYMLAERSKLVCGMPEGRMLSVQISSEEALKYCGDGVYLAAVNAPDLCVLSAEEHIVSILCNKLEANHVSFRKLNVNKTFHTPRLTPCADKFITCLEEIQANPPKIPWLSTVTNKLVTAADINSKYWHKHMCNPVLFYNSMQKIAEDVSLADVFIEIAPGRSLTSMVRSCGLSTQRIITGIYAGTEKECAYSFASALANCWQYGYNFSYEILYGCHGNRVSLPTYPFQKKRCWIDAPVNEEQAKKYITDISSSKIRENNRTHYAQWVSEPLWVSADRPICKTSNPSENKYVIIFTGTTNVADKIKTALGCQNVILVKPGDTYSKSSNLEYTIDYKNQEMYIKVFEDLTDYAESFGILHLAAFKFDTTIFFNESDFYKEQYDGLYSLLYISQAIIRCSRIKKIKMTVVTNDMFDILGTEMQRTVTMTLLSACKIISQENPWILCTHIDFHTKNEDIDNLIGKIIHALQFEYEYSSVSYRGNKYWYQSYQNVTTIIQNNNNCIKSGGIYLIAGGLGKMGLIFTRYLAENGASEIYLLNRNPFPKQDEWESYISKHNNETAQKCKYLSKIVSSGVNIHVITADITDINVLEKIKKEIVLKKDSVNGIIHAAGLSDSQSTASVFETQISDCETQFLPRVNGLLNLERIFCDMNLDFVLLNSSLSVNIGGLGLYSYAAAHSFFTQYCIKRNKESSTNYICVNWDRLDEESGITEKEFEVLLPYVFCRKMTSPYLIVSKENIDERILRMNSYDLQSTKAQTETLQNLPFSNYSTVDFLNSVWSELIGEEFIRDTDDFFELGGHSLLAIQMISRIKDEYKINLPIRYVFDHPTIREIAKHIDFMLNESSQICNTKGGGQSYGKIY